MILTETHIKKIIKSVLKEYIDEVSFISNNGGDFGNYGWCFIICGAPGSGKSYMLRNKLNFAGKVFDIDDFRMKYGDYLAKKGMDKMDFKTLQDLSGKKMKKQEKLFLSAQNPDRLGNIIFDVAGGPGKRGDSQSLIQEIISMVKPYGYRIAVCWCIANRSVALKRNIERGLDKDNGRTVIPDKAFHKRTNAVNKYLPEFLQSQFAGQIDKAFLFYSTSTGIHDMSDEEKDNCVFELKKKNGIFIIPEVEMEKLMSVLGPRETSNNWNPEIYMTGSEIKNMLNKQEALPDNFLRNTNQIMKENIKKAIGILDNSNKNDANDFADSIYNDLDEAIGILFELKERIELYREQKETSSRLDSLYKKITAGIDELISLM